MKITGGIHKGRNVIAPDENIVRPTLSKAREAVFSVLYSQMDFSNKSFLDMYAGSGIMSFEALSRGFCEVCAIEKNLKVVKIIKENCKNLDIDINLQVGDSLKKMKNFGKSFDVIYIDPPYYSGIYENTLERIKSNDILNVGGVVVLEHVVEVDWKNFGYSLIKQKEYSQKKISFLQ